MNNAHKRNPFKKWSQVLITNTVYCVGKFIFLKHQSALENLHSRFFPKKYLSRSLCPLILHNSKLMLKLKSSGFRLNFNFNFNFKAV